MERARLGGDGRMLSGSRRSERRELLAADLRRGMPVHRQDGRRSEAKCGKQQQQSLFTLDARRLCARTAATESMRLATF